MISDDDVMETCKSRVSIRNHWMWVRVFVSLYYPLDGVCPRVEDLRFTMSPMRPDRNAVEKEEVGLPWVSCKDDKNGRYR